MGDLEDRDPPLSHRPLSLFSQSFTGFGALALVALVVVRLAGQGTGAPLTLLSKDGRRTLPISVIGDQPFVALDDLAATLQLTVREESGALTVSYRGRTIVLTPDQALASVAGRLVSLPAAPTRAGGRFQVPLDFISRAVAPIYDARLDLRRPSRLLIIGDLRVPRVTIRHELSPNAARLTIDTAPPSTSSITQESGRLLIRFEADAIDVAIPAFQPQGVMQAIRAADAVSLAVDLGPRFASYRASTQSTDQAARVVIDLLAAATETSAPPAPPAPPAAPAPSSDLPVFGQPLSSIRTMAIDPGHGGDDIGAKGQVGASEKELTLAVARRLKATIEARLGIRVLLTRDTDRNLALNERIAVANNNKADLFISLHANASLRPAATGAAIYVAAFDDHDPAETALTPERLPVFGGGSRDIELVLWDLAQIRHINQSAELARILEQELRDRGVVDVRPVERAPFRVLESANMPAVLVEMGYLTNDEQARLLTGAEFQTTFVQAVVDSVLRFRGYLGTAGGEQ
jgi:N-acetylmuramoyl-L-alanine amidase